MFITANAHKKLLDELRELEKSLDVKNRRIQEIEQEHTFEIKEKDFELKHFKDEKVKELEEERAELDQKVAVLESQLTMMKQIVDLNGDIIDIKSLVSKLIDKLPEINLQNLTINGNGTK